MALSLLFGVLSMMSSNSADRFASVEEEFKKPPLAMKTVPLWHMNGRMTTVEIYGIHRSNLRKIRSFLEAGGMVIATTRLPDSSAGFGGDREVKEMVATMFPTSPVNAQGFARKTNEAGDVATVFPYLIFVRHPGPGFLL